MNKFIFFVLSLYSTFAMSDDFDCEQAMTTPQINYCAGVELTKAELQLKNYLTKSKEHNHNDAELVKSIDIAQKAWVLYAQAHCDSIYTKWREGSIRGVMNLSCKTKMTKARTHELWESFLTFMDSSSPVLPEPQL